MVPRLLSGRNSDLRRILSYLKPFRAQVLLALACAGLLAIFSVVPALMIRYLIDDLEHSRHSFSDIALLIAVGVMATIAGGLLSVAESYLTTNVGKSVVALLRHELFDHLLGQSVGYFARRRAGELMSRMLNDVGSIDDVIGSTMLSLFSASLTPGACVCVMFILSWQLSLVAFLIYPVVAVTVRLTRRSLFERNRAVREQFASLTAYLQEILGPAAVMIVRSFGREDRERARFAAANAEMRRLEVDAGRAGRWASAFLTVVRLVGPVAVLLVGSYLVLHHDLSLGTVVAFAAVAAMGLGGSLSVLLVGIFALYTSLPVWARIFEVLDESPDVTEPASPVALPHARGQIEFESVTFSYPGQERPALREISLSFEPGELVAIVGPSGAGKTTFTNLIARFYDPQRGRVLLDGHDLRDLSLKSVSDAIGLVLQDTFLFHATLRENLLYGRPDATQAELDEAVRHAALTPVVEALPDRYEAVVGDRGHRLSGGERQRVAIARVVLKGSPVLILDEATSQLDSLAEELVQSALAQLFNGRTSFVIAHRLSTVRAADRIIVLDHGSVAEQGTHRDLLRSNGLYAAMYQTQFAHAGDIPSASAARPGVNGSSGQSSSATAGSPQPDKRTQS